MNFENFLDKIGITISTAASFIFAIKLIYIIFSGKIKNYRFDFYNNFLLALSKDNIKLFIFNSPILFYVITICSTSVLLAFSPMILRCKEIHIKTFYFSLFLFFAFATIIRFITISLISNKNIISSCVDNIKCNSSIISNNLKYYLYFLAISPIIFDATCFRRSSSIVYSIFPSLYNMYLNNVVLYSSLYILITMIIVHLLRNNIKYVSRIIMFIFLIIIISSILNFDIKSLTGLFFIKNNVFTFYGFCMSIFYANLLAVYICDLFCICIEYIYVRYVDRELINKKIITEKQRYPFYMFNSILISILALLWVLIFINIGTTNMLNNSKSIPILVIKNALNFVFIIHSITNLYFLYDFIRLSNNKISYLSIPIIFICNYFWFPSVAIVSVIIYLISQLISCVELVRKL